MGTTAQKLQAVLNSKNKIKEKFNLPDDMPFSQYADNIKGGGGDINAELDTLNNELLTVNGRTIEASNAEPIEDINVELDVLNNELLEIKGE